VSGHYGTELVRRDDTPDIGYGRVHAVVSFDGVVDYNGDAHMGHISVSESEFDLVVESISERVKGYDVITFVEGSDDSGGD